MNDLDAFRILFSFAPVDEGRVSEILKLVDQHASHRGRNDQRNGKHADGRGPGSWRFRKLVARKPPRIPLRKQTF
jgi:hypothetical protein